MEIYAWKWGIADSLWGTEISFLIGEIYLYVDQQNTYITLNPSKQGTSGAHTFYTGANVTLSE